jgi:transglutaminase-like putative cysteine protease
MLNVHPSRRADLLAPDLVRVAPLRPLSIYSDMFGNTCCRLVAPAGELRIVTDTVVADSGLPDPVVPDAQQHAIADLPHDALIFLMGSRYCETDRLSEFAWSNFGKTPQGWARVQAIVDFVHRHIVPFDPAPMDYSAWFEAYLGGRWHTFDARHNLPRIGRLVIARGRDAADVAISTTFGWNRLKNFTVWTDEVTADIALMRERKVA